MHRGDLRSAVITRFIARPLRLSGPHHLRRGHPAASFYIGRGTRVLAGVADSPRAPCSSLAWLLACRWAARCCLRPRGVGFALVFNALAAWPAPTLRGSARSQNYLFSGLCVRFRATPFTSLLSLICPWPFSRPDSYTTERLTKPYSGGPGAHRHAFPLNRQPLPGYPRPRSPWQPSRTMKPCTTGQSIRCPPHHDLRLETADARRCGRYLR